MRYFGESLQIWDYVDIGVLSSIYVSMLCLLLHWDNLNDFLYSLIN